LEAVNARLQEELQSMASIPPQVVARLLRLPTQDEVGRMPLLVAVVTMMKLDLQRWLQLSRLRGVGHGAAFHEAMSTLSRRAALSRKILFLSKTQRLFYLWHVIHRPFSVSFALLVIIHVAVVLLLGYY
jgi:hypothetical protein